MRISRDSDHDPCPVPDEKLGELYRASKAGLPELIATVSPDIRAALAIYCYRRGHLKGIGLAVASTCECHDLEVAGGAAGAALFARSREVAPIAPAPSPYMARQKITLASGSLRKSLPLDQDAVSDDETDLEQLDAESETGTETLDTETLEAAAPDGENPEAEASDSPPPESA
jgi:hypothetical protein